MTAHVGLSVGLLGSVAAFAVLSGAGLAASDAATVRGAYMSMDLLARYLIAPVALASLLSGIVQALGTQWGLLRHTWVVAKLVLTAFVVAVLLAKLPLIANAAQLAALPAPSLAELRSMGGELLLHASGGLIVLVAVIALSVYKPTNRISSRSIVSRPAPVAVRQPHPIHGTVSPSKGSSAGASPTRWSITFTLRTAHATSAVVAVILVHVVALHIVGNAGRHF